MKRTYLFALISASLVVASVGCGSSSDTDVGSTRSSSGGEGAGGAGDGGKGGAASSSSSSGQGGAASSSSSSGQGGQGGAASSSSSSGQGGQGGQGGAASSSSGSSSSGSSSSGQGGAPLCADGETQACYSGGQGTEGIGQCKAGMITCVGGMFGPCVGEVIPAAEACNGKDDDCNGQTDELGSTTCGVGACQVTVQNCQNGAPVVCTPLPANAVEACEGTDDNCNGQIDEGCLCLNGATQVCYTGPNGTEGVGICAAGSQTCVNGAWAACVGSVTPGAEVCDGQDNNCNGSVDENMGTISCGIGACAATVPSCVGGVQQQCVPGAPTPEVCDGVDNNCDGVADNGLGTTSCGVGQCANTVPACNNGQQNVCNPLPSAPEICDGLDNNCNGQNDDGNPGGNLGCSTGLSGVCGPGTTACTNGMIKCNQNVQSSAELCDGLDNNCNGQVDDGNPGGNLGCSTGLQGVCGPGTTKCQNGSIQCNQNVQSSPEVCDGLDNNCNGQVDDGNPGSNQNCFTGLLGACAIGKTQCQGGLLVCVQTVFPAANETCDNIDNNCNGQIDENNPGGGGACTTGLQGICNSGTQFCLNGSLQCVQSQSAKPTDICGNALDDNCNGQVDESVDQDGDGWGTCTGDCCDAPGPCSGSPALVNPGAYEVVGDNVNNDCDAATSDSVQPADCSPPALQTPTTMTKLAQAMDICNFTTQAPVLSQKKWGVITNNTSAVTSADGIAAAPNDIQLGVLANYGTNVLPKKGSTMAALSSGTARDQGDAGWVQPNGGWQAGNTGNPPPVYLAAHGGVLQTKPGCTTGLSANDSANLRLKIRVPTNAKSFSYKFKFYTSEFPEWVCTLYNDFYLALLTSQVAGIPADHNISFDANNNPVSVNIGFFNVCQGCSKGTGELVGTGMGGNNGALNDGGGTEWLLTTSPIKPGEDMVIEFIVFDTEDHLYDSLVLLDDFKWDVNTAIVGTIGGQ